MNASKSLGLIFMGAIFIYLSFYGLYVPGIYGWQGNIYTDTFDKLDLSFWQLPDEVPSYLKISASGTLKFEFSSAPTKGDMKVIKTINYYDLSSGYIQVDMVVPSGQEKVRSLLFGIKFLDSSGNFLGLYRIDVSEKYNMLVAKLYLPGEAAKILGHGTYKGYQGKLKIKLSNNEVSFYAYDTSSPFCTANFQLSTSQYAQPFIGIYYDTQYYGLAEFDNFVMSVSSGGSPPPPPPLQGTLEVYCYVDGALTNPDNNLIYINGVQYTVTSTGYWAGNLYPGTYEVYAYYNGQMEKETATVIEGQTTKVTLSWGRQSPPTPPPTPPDFISLINEFISNPTVRSILLISGVALIGLGLIGLLGSASSRPRPPPPSPYY